MFNLVYTLQAEIDLKSAIDFIAEDSPLNALRYLSRYEEKLDLLRFNPLMGFDCKSKKIHKNCRILIHESHLIVYEVKEKTQEVLLLRIFHSAENYSKKF